MSLIRRKLLFVSSLQPFSADHPSSVREAGLLEILKSKMEVEEFKVPPTGKKPVWDGMLGRFSFQKQETELERHISTRPASGSILWISRSNSEIVLPDKLADGMIVIVDDHRTDLNLNARRSSADEKLFKQSRGWIVTCENESWQYSELDLEGRIHVLPHFIECASYSKAREHQGSSLVHAGNIETREDLEGLEWYAHEIVPRLKASIGTRMPRLIVPVSKLTPESVIDRLKKYDFDVRPSEGGLTPFLAESFASLLPLRHQFPSVRPRISVLESMASGRPVVTTGRGVEGLSLSPGFDILVADQEDRFASHIFRLFEDPKHRAETAARALETIESRYDWKCAPIVLEEILNRILR